MLYATVSRTVPSLRILWQRKTPSLFAPKRSIAACERVFNTSVSQHTTRQASVSNACDEFFHGGFLVCEWSFQAALGGLFEVFPVFGAVWGGIADDADVAVAQQDDEAADAENPAVQKV